jgi:transcriptional regulator with XRE-family HTH domain
MPTESVGILIARARQRRGLTQVELAKALGVTASTVADWERGEHYPAKYAGVVEEFLDISIPPRGEQVPA